MASHQDSRGGSRDPNDLSSLNALEKEIRNNPTLKAFLKRWNDTTTQEKQAASVERVLAVGLPVISDSKALDPRVPLGVKKQQSQDAPDAPEMERLKSMSGSAKQGAPQGAPFEEALLVVPEHFIDREDDLIWLKTRLTNRETAGIAALRGMGGMGKTSLAALAARQLKDERAFPDGIVVTLCRSKTQPAEVLREVLMRLDPYRVGPRDDMYAESELDDFAQRILANKKALVIFDDVEPGLDMTTVIRPLRKAGVSVLITSRQALSSAVIPAGGSRELDLLPPDEAKSVLIDAYQQNRTITLSDSQNAAAEEIVTLLQRHTLALRLAGSYAADTGRDLEAVATSLKDPARALGLSDAEQPAMITALFQQSADALPPPARRLFMALSAFGRDAFGREESGRGEFGFGRNAATALAQALNEDDPAHDSSRDVDLLVLRALLDSSRLTSQAQETELRETGGDYERMSLHRLLDAFAYVEFKRQSAFDQRRAYLAIASYYANNLQGASVVALNADKVNIYAAMRWAREEQQSALVVELCLLMRDYWREKWLATDSEGFLQSGIEAAEKLISQSGDPELERKRADLRFARARALRRLYNLDDAQTALQADLEYRIAAKDRKGEADALRLLGELDRLRGKLGGAKDYYEKSLHIWQEAPDQKRAEGAVLGDLGRVEHLSAHYDEAADYFAKSLQIAREQQDIQGIGRVYSSLGQVALARGDMPTAQDHFTQALEILSKAGDEYGESDALTGMGRLAIDHHQFDRARLYLNQSLKIDLEISDRAGEGVDRSLLAQVELEDGHLDEARRQFENNLPLRRRVHDARGEGVDQSFLGRIALEQGRLDDARHWYEEALKNADKVSNRRGRGATLCQLGLVAMHAGDAIDARRHLTESLKIAEDLRLDTDIARANLALGQAAILLDGDKRVGCQYISTAIRINTERKRTLDLERAQTIARELGCSSALDTFE